MFSLDFFMAIKKLIKLIKGHFFKKAIFDDKEKYPTGEFFSAKVYNQGEFKK